MTTRFPGRSKAVFLSAIVLSTVALSGALTWENPSSNNDKFSSKGIKLAVHNTSASGSVDFWYDSGSGYQSLQQGVSNSGNWFNGSYASSLSDGTYDLKVNSTGYSDTVSNIVFDTQSPNLDSKSPTGDISDGSPTVDVDVSDSGDAGVSYTFLNVTDSDNNDVGSTKGTSLDLDGLDDEQHTVDYSIVDEVGNWNNNSWTFTVDTSYKADKSPNSLNWDPQPSDGIFKLESGDKVDLEVLMDESGEGNANEDVDKVKCYDGSTDDGDNLVDTDDFSSADNNQLKATCELDTDDDMFDDGSLDLQLKFLDAAGNTATSDEGDYTFDTSKPVVSLEEKEASVFNSKFELGFSASDSAGVRELEYFFEEGTEEGKGTQVDIEDGGSVDSSFEVDTSALESGTHTVYVRVKDAAGRWSSTDSFQFDYYPNEDPEISVDAPSNVEVTAGKERQVTISVKNTGQFIIQNPQVNVSGLTSRNKELDQLDPGESTSFDLTFTPSEEDIGEKTIKLDSDHVESAKNIGVRVKATESQRASISQKLSEYRSKLEALEKNASEVISGVKGDTESAVKSNMSAFRSKVQKAANATESGKYYEAQDILSSIESDYSAASSSIQNAKEEIRKSRKKNLMLAGGVILLLVLAGTGFYGYREGYFDELEVSLPDMDVDTSAISDLIDGISSGTSEEESGDDFEWDGFN